MVVWLASTFSALWDNDISASDRVVLDVHLLGNFALMSLPSPRALPLFGIFIGGCGRDLRRTVLLRLCYRKSVGCRRQVLHVVFSGFRLRDPRPFLHPKAKAARAASDAGKAIIVVGGGAGKWHEALVLCAPGFPQRQMEAFRAIAFVPLFSSA